MLQSERSKFKSQLGGKMSLKRLRLELVNYTFSSPPIPFVIFAEKDDYLERERENQAGKNFLGAERESSPPATLIG
jgi:hypothetical protein